MIGFTVASRVRGRRGAGGGALLRLIRRRQQVQQIKVLAGATGILQDIIPGDGIKRDLERENLTQQTGQFNPYPGYV